MVLAKKVKQMKTNYARTMQNNTAANNNNMCGGTGAIKLICAVGKILVAE